MKCYDTAPEHSASLDCDVSSSNFNNNNNFSGKKRAVTFKVAVLSGISGSSLPHFHNNSEHIGPLADHNARYSAISNFELCLLFALLGSQYNIILDSTPSTLQGHKQW